MIMRLIAFYIFHGKLKAHSYCVCKNFAYQQTPYRIIIKCTFMRVKIIKHSDLMHLRLIDYFNFLRLLHIMIRVNYIIK